MIISSDQEGGSQSIYIYTVFLTHVSFTYDAFIFPKWSLTLTYTNLMMYIGPRRNTDPTATASGSADPSSLPTACE